MSAYESAPGTAPVKIVRYSTQRPIGDSIAAAAPEPAVPVSYDELIRSASVEADVLSARLRQQMPSAQ